MSKRCNMSKIKQRIIPERVIQSDSCTKCYSVCIDCVEERDNAVAELKKRVDELTVSFGNAPSLVHFQDKVLEIIDEEME